MGKAFDSFSGIITFFFAMCMVCGLFLAVKELKGAIADRDQATQNTKQFQTDLAKAHQLIEEIFKIEIDKTFSTYSIPVTVSAYTARAEECDATPEVTADMTPSRIGLLAVSRDLIELMGFRFGDSVMLIEDGVSLGVFTISDLMNARFESRVDILHGNIDAARLFGVKKNVSLIRVVGDRR